MAQPEDNAAAPAPTAKPPRNPHASSSRWRHQESSRYAKYASLAKEGSSATHTSKLAHFLSSHRAESSADEASHTPDAVDGTTMHTDGVDGPPADGREIVCGPLLNYRRTEEGYWLGSVLVVVRGGGVEALHTPSLNLRRLGNAKHGEGLIHNEPSTNGTEPATSATTVQGERLYSDKRNTFWQFDIRVPLERSEIKYAYDFNDMRFSAEHKPKVNNFFIPAVTESMRLMFHSCNGFSVGTDEDAYSGAALWNDVLRKHEQTPFHVMLGGGDQIYNDGIRVHGPLRPWTSIRNPKKREKFPFSEKLREECDDYYLKNYIQWYNSAPFAVANGQIAQVNIWDDHDIIDGFGSYVDGFMRCDVFRGIGGTAHKYYMLFQHHMAPPKSTYTSDYKNTDTPDPQQLIDTFVAEPKIGSQYILGSKPGPYVAERAFNMYTRLGARMAMVGIDARTERTRHQVNYPETYKLVFDRLRSELQAASSSGQPIHHLVLLLGIPIAYPRLTWLENVLRSPLIGPIKFMHKRFGVGGGLFNQFDGGVDLLDDLDDHYTARTHKKERLGMIEELQKVAAEFSVRVTILGGDVHLAALGRFYANPKLKIPAEEDHRYMANIVSSAIVNKPPPQAVANLLARRNKIHHLNKDTDETLLDFFDKDPGTTAKTANHNHCTMPSRNFAMLTENSPHNQPNANSDGAAAADANADATSKKFEGKDGHSELHQGEVGAGTAHKAASDELFGRGHDGSIDIRINVEMDQHDSDGRTQAYGLTVPRLQYRPGVVSTHPPQL